MYFYIYTLGCKVNTYESNIMRDVLLANGYMEGEKEQADIIIINTCSVTNTADQKSFKMVHQARKWNEKAIVIVAGCSSQNQKERFEKEAVADIILGNQFKSKIIDYIEEYKQKRRRKTDVQDMRKAPFENMQLTHFKGTRAFVKIQDGCNNFCSYCIIPFVRGNVRSKPVSLVLQEVKQLVACGKKEIVLTGIHTGNYGRDLHTSLSSLLKELVKIKELERIRISSIEITELDQEFMDVFAKEKKIVSHLHIPLQSGSDMILKQMNRKYDKSYFLEKIKQLRLLRPNLSITTDVIVGFPKESDALFAETIDTIKQARFSKIHVFPYSKREGTKAATMNKQVTDKIKKERVQMLLRISKELECAYMSAFIGKEVFVLPEVEDREWLIGHTDNYLQVKYKGTLKEVHSIEKVRIQSFTYPYLEAEKIDESVYS